MQCLRTGASSRPPEAADPREKDAPTKAPWQTRRRGTVPFDEAGCGAGTVGRVRKGDIDALLQPGQETEDVVCYHGTVHGSSEELNVAPNHRERPPAPLHHHDGRGSAAQGLEAQRTRACEEIQHGSIHDPSSERRHPGFPNTIDGRPHVSALERLEAVALPAAGDDPQSSLPDGLRSASLACGRARPLHSFRSRRKRAS